MELDSLKIANLLAEAGEVHFFCKELTFLHEQAQQRLSARITLHPVGFERMISLRLASALRGIFRTFHIGNVLFFGASELGSIYLGMVGLELNLMIQHGTTKRRPKNSPYHRLIYRAVRHHIAVSEHLARNVAEIIPTRPEQIHVIYTAVRTQVPHPRPFPNASPLRLLHVGRISQGKGQWEAVRACAALHEANIPFELTLLGSEGKPEEAESLRQLISEQPYADRIHLPGFSPDVAAYYRQSHLFLFPSAGEGMSNAILEALYFGLQCVCFANTSFPELAGLGLHLYLAKDQDEQDLSQQLLRATRALEHDLPQRIENTHIIAEKLSLEAAKAQFLRLMV